MFDQGINAIYKKKKSYQVSKNLPSHLHFNRLNGRHARKKHFLSGNNKCKCLKFVNHYYECNCNHVLWSETIFFLFVPSTPCNLIHGVHGIMVSMKYHTIYIKIRLLLWDNLTGSSMENKSKQNWLTDILIPQHHWTSLKTCDVSWGGECTRTMVDLGGFCTEE